MADLPSTRKSLIIELGKRSDSAWTEFLRIYEDAIIGYCVRRGLQQADALDVAQAVYSAIQDRMPSWDCDSSRGSFRAWIFRVARNISVDLVKHRARNIAVGTDTLGQQQLPEVADHRGTPKNEDEESTIFQLEMRRSLFEWACRQVKQEVQAVTWQAFQLSAIEGKKANEVASLLSIPVGSVYTAKCRVMARIRNAIETWDPSDVNAIRG